MLWLCIACAALVLLVVFLVMPGRARHGEMQPFIGWCYAHRGLHTKDLSVPENTLAAFCAAADAGYGMELDVQLSQDGQVVVFHDDTLDRITAASGRVDAQPYAMLKTLPIHGTAHTIPLFCDVLAQVAGRTPLIVELKSTPRAAELCQKTLELLRGYNGAFCVESFDPTIVAWFRRNAPDVCRGQLANNYADYKSAPAWLRFALSRCLGNVAARPHFIAWGDGKKNLLVRLAEAMGAAKIYWTARPNNSLAALQAEYDGIIFEYDTPNPRFEGAPPTP